MLVQDLEALGHAMPSKSVLVASSRKLAALLKSVPHCELPARALAVRFAIYHQTVDAMLADTLSIVDVVCTEVVYVCYLPGTCESPVQAVVHGASRHIVPASADCA